LSYALVNDPPDRSLPVQGFSACNRSCALLFLCIIVLPTNDFLFNIPFLSGLYIRCLYLLLKKKEESGLKE